MLKLDYRIQRLVKEGTLSQLKIEPVPTCKFCLEGKMTKRLFLVKRVRAIDYLELVHVNARGLINI